MKYALWLAVGVALAITLASLWLLRPDDTGPPVVAPPIVPPTTWTLPPDAAVSVEGAWLPQVDAPWPTWYRVDGSQLTPDGDGTGWVVTVSWQTRQQNPNGINDLSVPMTVAIDDGQNPAVHVAAFADFGPADRRTSRYRLGQALAPALGHLLWGPQTATGMPWGIELAPRCNATTSAAVTSVSTGRPELSVLRASARGCDWLRWSAGALHPVAQWEGDCAVHVAMHPSGQQAVLSGWAIPWALRGIGQGAAPLLGLPPAPPAAAASAGPAAANVAAWDAHGGLHAATYARQAHGTPLTWLERSTTGWTARGETPAIGVGCFDAPLQGRFECRTVHRNGWPDTFPTGRVADECATPAGDPIDPNALALLNQRFSDRRPGLRWQQVAGVLAYTAGNARGDAPMRFAAPALLLRDGALWEIPGGLSQGRMRFVVRGDYALFTDTDNDNGRPRYRLVHLPDGHTVTTLEGGGVQAVQFWPAGAAADRLSRSLSVGVGVRVGVGTRVGVGVGVGVGGKHVGRAHRHERH